MMPTNAYTSAREAVATPTPGFAAETGPGRAGYRYRLMDRSGVLWEDTDRDRLFEHVMARDTDTPRAGRGAFPAPPEFR